MSARNITAALGGRWRMSYGMVPCPIHADRTPSAKISDDPRKADGIDVICFAGCDWREIKAAWVARGLLEQHTPRQQANIPHDDMDRRIDRARHMWRNVRPIRDGDPADLYMRKRGFEPPYPPTLRHGIIQQTDIGQLLPAMAAPIAHWPDRIPRGVHVTYLTENGDIAPISVPRKMFGICKGGAVRLGAVSDILALAEGIESALAYQTLRHIPTWAALSATNLRSVIIPDNVKRVVLAVDVDDTGLREAEASGNALVAAGLDVEIDEPGDTPDWADELMFRKGLADG